MLFDSQGLFSDKQAITAPAASTNVIDTGAPQTPHGAKAAVHNDKGKGNPIPVRLQATSAFTGTATNVIVTLQASAAAGFGTFTTLASFTLARTALTEGAVIPLEFIPRGAVQRFLRLYYDPVDNNGDPSTLSGGAITAGIVLAGDEGWR